MLNLTHYEIWFVTGSQHLYGDEALKQVADDSEKIAKALNDSDYIPAKVVFKALLTGPEEIQQLAAEANAAENCVGLITWMHTFSPAKMWIRGLKTLQKPFVHFHTQFNESIPWSDIDMDFMNLNQSAHGGREFGFMCTRMCLNRKVVVGHWKDDEVLKQLDTWTRAACAWHDAQGMRVARFGDNMRNVAVTEGDKVEAQMQLGYSVDAFGVGDLAHTIDHVSADDVEKMVNEYKEIYKISSKALNNTDQFNMIKEAARIELGMRAFLQKGDFKAFTTNFENLHGLVQLPGLAVQRLMESGYGFGAEGDWKTAALVRSMKVMASGLNGGTSFMEDYTYHFGPGQMQVLGAHMLEVCSSLADGQPALEVHPLGIGNKADPARLVFNVAQSAGLNASVVDMGNRFRMIVNAVDVVPPAENLPKLPVARVVWIPKPDLKAAAAAWIHAGGAHHTGFSQALTAEHLEDFANMAGIEYLLIDENTRISEFKKELVWNETYFQMKRGF